MFFSRSSKTVKVMMVAVVAMLTLVVMIIPAGAASNANNGNGFGAINGAAAQAYRIPNDMAHVNQMEMGKYNAVSNRYQQYKGQAQVFGGQVTVYTDATTGDTMAVIGAHYDGITASNTVQLNNGQARAIVAREIGESGAWTTELMIDPASGTYFYIVESRGEASRMFYWINAETGATMNAYDGLAEGGGTGVLGDTKTWTDLTRPSGSGYEMVSVDGRFTTYDAKNRSRLPGSIATDADDLWNSADQGALVDAHYYASVTDNYFLSTHGFNWTDHYPQGMVSSAHVQRNYNNAYWNGSQMAYGDGDGSVFIALSGDLDVVGHELSHGVTEATSGLIYQNESGALNESFSDIMGTAIEYFYGTGNWTLGEDITPNDNGLRSLSNPNEDGDPSHYGERYTGTGDNGGVHINSGISNHFFYLLVNGGQNANSSYASGSNVQGIGLAAAEQIAFLGYTALPPNADFCAARASTVAVAGNNSANVADAWNEVGVDDALCNGGGGGGGTGDGPVISNVSSVVTNAKRGQFTISWTTDVASDTTVTINGTDYSDTALVTSHSKAFNGSKNATYTYYVTSSNADGTTTEGPFTHQN